MRLEISFHLQSLSANAFDTVIDIVLKGTKNCTPWETLIDTKQVSSTVLNIVTTYAWTGSVYVVPSATKGWSISNDKKFSSRMGKIRNSY
jgi:hypothetical protein